MIRLTFRASPRTAELAARLGVPADRGVIEVSTFTVRSLTDLLQLWALVHRHGTLEVDGVFLTGRERLAFLGVLDCAARAAGFDPPQRYCYSHPPLDGLPALPCRLWAASWAPDRAVEWDGPRRLDQARAALADLGITRCPFLDLDPFVAELGAGDVERMLRRMLD